MLICLSPRNASNEEHKFYISWIYIYTFIFCTRWRRSQKRVWLVSFQFPNSYLQTYNRENHQKDVLITIFIISYVCIEVIYIEISVYSSHYRSSVPIRPLKMWDSLLIGKQGQLLTKVNVLVMKVFDDIKLWSKAIPCLCKGTNLFYIKINTHGHNKAGQFEKKNGLLGTLPTDLLILLHASKYKPLLIAIIR